jgi:hypothetical protein
VRRRDDLQLRRRHLELEPRVAAERRDHVARMRRQVEGLRVEQHQLLLEPHRRRVVLIERRAQLGGGGERVRHGP